MHSLDRPWIPPVVPPLGIGFSKAPLRVVAARDGVRLEAEPLALAGWVLLAAPRCASVLHESGGEIGIRTLDRLPPILDFDSSAFDHSAISPLNR